MQVGKSRLTLEEAMALYDLQHSEVFHDPRTETKMLMAWSRTVLICSFRGTGGDTPPCNRHPAPQQGLVRAERRAMQPFMLGHDECSRALRKPGPVVCRAAGAQQMAHAELAGAVQAPGQT